MDIRNTRALVTGASRGLGLALSRALAARGARVAMVARGEAALREAASAVRADGGVAFAIAGDLGAKRDTHRIAGQAAALLGGVDLLIHNASELGPTPLRPLLDTECEDLERVFAVNVIGPQRLTRALAGAMSLHRNGFVLFVSSDAAREAYPGWGPYGASKAAADQLARVWSEELREAGVGVASVDPGEMDTAMHAAALPDAARESLQRPEEVARQIVDALASDRVATGSRFDASAVPT